MMANSTKTRGHIAVEAAILLPGLIALLAFAILLSRIQEANQTVEQAANMAARAASISRNVASANKSANQVANTILADSNCLKTSVVIDANGLLLPVGVPAVAKVTATCTISLADLGIPGVPGELSLEASSSSPIDAYRER
ncbi:MAG: pilus assembly protein TadE [Actinomycetales bacterium]|nr:MAG: pilus assembly protein TadE [Actinomycetales bacterium]